MRLRRIGTRASVSRACLVTGLVLVLGSAAGCAGSPRSADQGSNPREALGAVALKGTLDGGPVAPPKHGAYFGAYVHPKPVTQAGRIGQVADLQRRLGRHLDVVHTYRGWRDPFGTRSDLSFQRAGATLLYSWSGTDTRQINSGRYDRLIAERARRVRAMRRPILLEWRWEMDRPNLRSEVHSATAFLAAWHRIQRIFRAQHATNAAWVWCPTADGFAGRRRALDYYPGDASVDWLCVDAYPGRRHYRTFAAVTGPFLAWANKHAKPIIIGEYGAPSVYGSRRQAEWLRAATATMKKHPQIKAACYYESDNRRRRNMPRYSIRDNPRPFAALRAMARDRYFNP